MNLIEVFGIVSSIVILVSLSMTSIIKLRVINLVGCLLFAGYGYAIGSFSTMFMNIGIAFMNLYYLRKLYSIKESYEIVRADRESDYFKLFIEKNAGDIDKFFSRESLNQSQEIYYLLRNNYTAGIIGWKTEGTDVEITIDYVTERFRDYTFGKYIFQERLEMFRKEGYKRLVQKTENPLHQNYLKKIGFFQEKNGVFIKNI
ncbi:MAG: hypothetical protein ACRDB2_07305 [Fusobacteriaceae bacterium]